MNWVAVRAKALYSIFCILFSLFIIQYRLPSSFHRKLFKTKLLMEYKNGRCPCSPAYTLWPLGLGDGLFILEYDVTIQDINDLDCMKYCTVPRKEDNECLELFRGVFNV